MAEMVHNIPGSARARTGNLPAAFTRPGANIPMSVENRRRYAADVEAEFTGRPQPFGTFSGDDGAAKVSAESAGYMELEGAAKDGDCGLVSVVGGVSGEKGCCNLFDPSLAAAEFNCMNCEHFVELSGQQTEVAHD